MANDLDYVGLLKELTAIGAALSVEKNHARLLDMILEKAKALTNADGATLYECTEDKHLAFKIMITESWGIFLGGTSGKEIPFSPLPLFDKDNRPNTHMVSTYAAISRKTINIKDAYREKKFDFSGTFAHDKKIGYRSISFLTVPMTNHINEVIGVLQLINVQDKKTKAIVPFSKLDQQIVESLASQAAMSITNRTLIEAQKKLFDALIQLIAIAINEKSPYTAGHCRRVPILTQWLAEAACRIDKGPLKDFTLTEDEMYELQVAAWLHDCGKITTPEYVVDKATKLETIYDRIHLLDLRFEVLKRDALIDSLYKKLKAPGQGSFDAKAETSLQQFLHQLDEDQAFLHTCNMGQETISDKDIANIMRIATYPWLSPSGKTEPFLSTEEVENLSISRGTLSAKERSIINNHVRVTADMLASLPYPKNMQRVPEFAGCHHEKIDGTGYPKGLTGTQLSIQARIITIADVFEALSACDRPYKKAMPLSQCLTILGKMKLSGHIDPDLFDVFMHEKIYLRYAKAYLKESDPIDVTKIPGYVAL